MHANSLPIATFDACFAAAEFQRPTRWTAAIPDARGVQLAAGGDTEQLALVGRPGLVDWMVGSVEAATGRIAAMAETV